MDLRNKLFFSKESKVSFLGENIPNINYYPNRGISLVTIAMIISIFLTIITISISLYFFFKIFNKRIVY